MNWITGIMIAISIIAIVIMVVVVIIKSNQLKVINGSIKFSTAHLQVLENQKKQLEQDMLKVSQSLRDLRCEVDNQSWYRQELVEEISRSTSALAAITSQYELLKRELEENQQKVAQYEGLQGRLQELEGQVNTAQKKVQELEANEASKKEILTAMQSEESQLTSQLNDLRRKKDEVWDQLYHLQESHRQAIGLIGTADGNGEGIDPSMTHPKGYFKLSDAQKRLLKLLDEVVELYPELREALMTVAWKKVWLPEIQRITKVLGVDGTVSGIYRLSWVKDEKVCYIGQAVKISERWYTHIKKMIGVEAKGNERLYAAINRPDEVTWEVVEVWDGKGEDRSKWLNEREEWWIETMGAREIGWNKK